MTNTGAHTQTRSSFLSRHTPTSLCSHTTHLNPLCSLGFSYSCLLWSPAYNTS